jgi:ribosome recycling factor
MLDEVIGELEQDVEKAIVALKRDLGKLRTGRAHPTMLEGLKVDYYGQITPIAQMATVAAPEPRMLTVKPWDKGQVKAVEKALRESDLGLNPQVDGDVIRVPVPPLSEDRRKDLVKVAKKHGEECRVAIRKARHDALDVLNELKKEGGASEDEVERIKKRAEEVASAGSQSVERVIQQKEKDILAI